MAIQSIPGGLWIPQPVDRNGSIGVTQTATMSNAAARAAIVLMAPKAGAIRKVIWGTGTVTTGATVDVRIESVDTTTSLSPPSGTLLGTNTNASQVVADGDDNTIFTTTLTADATVTRGQLIAVVVANASPGNMQALRAYPADSRPWALPYVQTFNGTSWSVGGGTQIPAISLEYSDGSYAPIVGVLPPTSAVTSGALNTGSTPDVAGLRFRLPFSARVSGAWVSINNGAAPDYKVMLVSSAYNQGAGTGILATGTVQDGDVRATNAGRFAVVFDSAVTLTASTYYRLIVEPTSGTNVGIYAYTAQSLAMLDAWEGGRDFHYTTAKDPTGDGDWTNYNSGTFMQPFMGLQIDGIDVASVSSTETSHPFVGFFS